MPTVPTSPRDVAGNNSDGGSSMSSGFVTSEESQRSAESSSASQGDANREFRSMLTPFADVSCS
jgi:hypothetical protein